MKRERIFSLLLILILIFCITAGCTEVNKNSDGSEGETPIEKSSEQGGSNGEDTESKVGDDGEDTEGESEDEGN